MLRKTLYGVLAVLLFGLAALAFLAFGPARQHTLDTALYLAAKRGFEPGMKAAVFLGGDVNTRDLGGAPLVLLLAADDNAGMVRWLAGRGADVGAADRDGNTALHAAADNGAAAAAAALLEAGARNAPNAAGASPLQAAIWSRNFAVAHVILHAGAPTDNQEAAWGSTALLDAIDAGDGETIRLLLDKGADVTATDRFGWSPLRKAAYLNSVEAARLLLEHGADLEARDRDGWTALLTAAASGRLAAANFLLDRGADANAAANDGRTALMRAATLPDAAMLTLLLERGADRAARDIRGYTAEKHAQLAGRAANAALLRRGGR